MVAQIPKKSKLHFKSKFQLKNFISYVSSVTCQMSPVPCHLSCVTCHVSPNLSPTPTAIATDSLPANSSTLNRRLAHQDRQKIHGEPAYFPKNPKPVQNLKNSPSLKIFFFSFEVLNIRSLTSQCGSGFRPRAQTNKQKDRHFLGTDSAIMEGVVLVIICPPFTNLRINNESI